MFLEGLSQGQSNSHNRWRARNEKDYLNCRLASESCKSGASALAGIVGPSDSQSVQQKVVSQIKPTGINHSLIGVANERPERDTPWFVANYSLAVLARLVGTVLVAVQPGFTVDG
jgi:hypothetical protein